MRSRGVVKTDGRQCVVAVVRQSACGENCASCGGCSLSETEIVAENVAGARAGDKVILEIPDKAALKAAWIVYVIPILFLLAAVIIGTLAGLEENAVIPIALISLILAFSGIKLYLKYCKEHYSVKIVEVLT